MPKVVLPIGQVDAIRQFAAHHIPIEHLDKARLEVEIRGRSVTLVEFEKPWIPDTGPEWYRRRVAQFRFDPDADKWALYCLDSNDRLWPYIGIDEVTDVALLLDEVAADPTGIFWG